MNSIKSIKIQIWFVAKNIKINFVLLSVLVCAIYFLSSLSFHFLHLFFIYFRGVKLHSVKTYAITVCHITPGPPKLSFALIQRSNYCARVYQSTWHCRLLHKTSKLGYIQFNNRRLFVIVNFRFKVATIVRVFVFGSCIRDLYDQGYGAIGPLQGLHPGQVFCWTTKVLGDWEKIKRYICSSFCMKIYHWYVVLK